MGAVSSSLYKGHRYPAEIISHCVWLYHRFPLSFRAYIPSETALGRDGP
jgi:putative transposase